jgi:hypothetical protein
LDQEFIWLINAIECEIPLGRIATSFSQSSWATASQWEKLPLAVNEAHLRSLSEQEYLFEYRS